MWLVPAGKDKAYWSVDSFCIAGGFVVVWHSAGSSGTDTSFFSVQGQRFAGASTLVPGLSCASRVLLAAVLMLPMLWRLRRRSGLPRSARE
jgi:hypothetical protein